MKFTCRFVFSILLFLSITTVFSQNYSDQQTGFDATRITLALKKRGLTDQSIQQEVTLMRKLHNQQYAEMKKSEDEILQKITSELTLKAETNTPVNTTPTAKSASTLKTANTLATDIPQTEKDALLSLYNSTNGNNWTNKTGWDFSTPVTSGWYGISVIGGHVNAINLSNNNLNGTIPAAIGQLTELQTLYLNNNQLSGAIPVQIGQLTKLINFYLHQNQLSGTIPVEIGQLTQLQILSLYSNQLSGTIPTTVGQLSKLQYLYLNNNQLSGTIPSEIQQLINIIYINFGTNQLSGTIPIGIGLLTKLTSLSLYTNQLTGTIPPEIGLLTQLLELNLSNNKLNGAIPASVGQLIKLQNLYLNNNQLTGTIPISLGQLIQLQNFYLSGNQLSGTIPTSIGQLTKLTSLYLHVNQLSGTIPTEIGQLIQLQNLFLQSNQLSGSIPVEIGLLTKLQNLQLYTNKLNGSIPVSIGQLTQLNTLYVNDNQLTGTIPPSIGLLTKLTSFYLNQNQLTGTIPASVGQLIQLQDLRLHSNQLSGTIPSSIGQLTKLTTLYLGTNQLSGKIPVEIGQLQKIQILHLSNNQLTGSIPTEIGQLNQLRTLYLNNNLISGTLPREIGQLKLLQQLYLQSNQLNGTIPSEIGQLTQVLEVALFSNQLKGSIPIQIGQLTKLTSLQLNGNQLSGSIPAEISQLTELQTINLSGNQLTGSIPAEIRQLIKLKNLYLNNNQLSGTIPVEIGLLTQLLEVFLYSNKLSGTIPASIGQLTKLKSLALYNNQLTGTIPVEIGQLTDLIALYLNQNQLTGTIPASIGQLAQLKIVNLYSNQLESTIPSLTNVISSLSFHMNKFRFADFASQFSAYKTKLTLFEYYNQAKTDTETTITKTVGETQTLTMYEDNRFTPADTYQWYKNGTAISGATSRQYTLSNLTVANAGDYYCISTNPQMTIASVTNQNLILTRNTIHLNVNNCNAFLSSAVGTNAQTICASAAITPITYTTAGLITGATFSGLPAGVTGNFASNTVTISGTPAAEGTFAYTVTYTGSCGSTVTSKGTITIQTKTVNAASAAPFVCINTAIVPIIHTTSGGVLTVGTPSGLPSGVTAVWASNILTITGIPTTAGIFNYSIPLLGGCGDTLNATGTITVSIPGTIMLSSAAGTDNQSKNINTTLTPITYTTTGTTGAGVTGLPAGVTGSFASNTVTITGTPAVSGTFNYLVTLTGECNTIISGKITSLCEPITGVIKIITEPVQTSYPFQFSNAATIKSTACNENSFPNTFYADTPTLALDTVIYSNENLTTPVTTGTFWYKKQGDNTAYRISSAGKIITISSCSTSGSGPGYAYRVSNGKNGSGSTCSQSTYPNTYYASGSSLWIGAQMYLDSGLTSKMGGGDELSSWYKCLDPDVFYAFKVGAGGIVTEIVTCGGN